MLNKIKNYIPKVTHKNTEEVKKGNSKRRKDNKPEDGLIKQIKAQGVNVDLKLAKFIASNLSNIKTTGLVSLNTLVDDKSLTDLNEDFVTNVNSGEYLPDIVNLHLKDKLRDKVQIYLITTFSNKNLLRLYTFLKSKEDRCRYVQEYIDGVVLNSGARDEIELQFAIAEVIEVINKNYKE